MATSDLFPTYKIIHYFLLRLQHDKIKHCMYTMNPPLEYCGFQYIQLYPKQRYIGLKIRVAIKTGQLEKCRPEQPPRFDVVKKAPKDTLFLAELRKILTRPG